MQIAHVLTNAALFDRSRLLHSYLLAQIRNRFSKLEK